MTTQEVKLSGRELTQLYQQEHQHMQQLESRRNDAIALIADVEAAKAALKSIKDIPKDNSAVIPLGSGIFTEAKITDTKNVKINLPGGVVVTQSMDEALKRLALRKEQLKKDMEQFEKERQRIEVNLNEMGKIIQQGKQFALSELEKKVGESKPEGIN